MKLSTNSRYGLRAMVDLAANWAGEPVALCDIARRQHISESYLEQSFATLRRAGLVRSTKGAQGGYEPARSPQAIRAGAVLLALEGDLSIVSDSPVFHGDDPIQRCIRELVWDAVDLSILQAVDSVTLADMAGEYRRMRGDAQDLSNNSN